MAYCPSPGPPCYTMKGSFKWDLKYFSNPIVSGVQIEAQILDMDKNPLVKFNPVTGPSNPVAGGGYFYYEPNQTDLKMLKGHKRVIYKLKEKGRPDEPDLLYEFEIEVC